MSCTDNNSEVECVEKKEQEQKCDEALICKECTTFLRIVIVDIHDLQVEAKEVPEDLERVGQNHGVEGDLWCEQKLFFVIINQVFSEDEG